MICFYECIRPLFNDLYDGKRDCFSIEKNKEEQIHFLLTIGRMDLTGRQIIPENVFYEMLGVDD